MNSILKRFGIILSLLVLALSQQSFTPISTTDFEQEWKAVEQLFQKGLPKSAAEKIEMIHQQALAQNNQPQLLKTIIYRFKVLEQTSENPIPASISYAKAKFTILDKPSQAFLHTLIAELYTAFYQQNRYRLLERQYETAMSSDELMRWNLPQLRDTIRKHYAAALPPLASFDKIALEKYAPVLTATDKESLELQPTLFDFLSQSGIRYFLMDDAGLNISSAIDKAVFEYLWLPAPEFALADISANGDDKLHALKLMQPLLRTNLSNRHFEAYVYNDLQRFETVYSLSDQADADQKRYADALKTLQQFASSWPVSTEVAAVRANFLVQQQNSSPQDSSLLHNKALALALCEEAIQSFPESRGAKKCALLKAEIRSKTLQLETQAVVLPAEAIPARLQYRNITKAYFRLIRIGSTRLAAIRKQDDIRQQITALSLMKAEKSWQITIPSETDYNSHSSLIALPAVNKGLYVLLASYQEDFAGEASVFGSFQVSELSFIQHKQADLNRFFVLDRNSGAPVNKVQAHIMIRNYDYQLRDYVVKKVHTAETDKDGSFVVDKSTGIPQNQAFYVELFYKGDSLYSDNYFDQYSRRSVTRTQTKTWFFTDRAIYRPGQTVYFKGISLQKEGRDYEIVSDMETEVELLDVNNQRVGLLSLSTNTYGSFEGRFVLPASGLNGQYRLRNKHGAVSIAVEAYKRPEFEVVLDQPQSQYQLNETVLVSGEARAFAGFPLDNVTVNYRIERAAEFPYWRYWWGIPPFSGQSETIALGTLTTDEQGGFQVPLQLLPAPHVKAADQPVFTFTLYVDVLDKQGETQSSQLSLRAGYQALLLSTNLEDLVSSRQFKKYQLHARNLQGKAVKSTISRKFYLMESERAFVSDSWIAFDRQLISADSLQQLFPLMNYYPKHPLQRSKTLVYSDSVEANGQFTLFPDQLESWQAGEYLMQLEAVDDFGKAVESTQTFTLFDPQSRKAIPGKLFVTNVSADTALPGDEVSFNLSTEAPDSFILVEIWAADTLRYSKWLKADSKQLQIPYVVKEGDRGKLSFQAVMVRYNEIFTQNSGLKVPFDNRKLDIELLSIRDQLQPGAQEQWELIIRDVDKLPATAELLAAMYDASLDQIRGHSWYFDILPELPLQRSWTADQGFYESGSSYLYHDRNYRDYPQPVAQPKINYFGLYMFSGYYGQLKGRQMHNAGEVVLESVLAVENDESELSDDQTNGATITKQETEAPAKAESAPLRTNFNETAFFYPQLQTDEAGIIRIKFTTPDALTRWKLLLLAHDKSLNFGQKEYAFTSSKPLMIMGNLPRFYYEGDTAIIAARVVNTGDEIITGIARLEVFDAITMQSVQLLSDAVQKPFVQLKPGQSRMLSWKIQPQADHNLIALRFSASSGKFTDAEQKLLPVLSRKTLVTETVAITVNGKSDKRFVLEKPDAESTSTKQLVLNLSSNPVWYAIQALPYLAENKQKNADQIFYRLYTNVLAAYIANQIPQLMASIDQWRTHSPEAFLSQLEKDPELKNIVLNETPWLLDAQDEAAQKARIALLFDLNRLRYEQQQSIRRLRDMQLGNGAWPWFEGMPESRFVTRAILQGFGQLQQLGIASEALDADDRRIMELFVRKARAFVQAELTRDYVKLREKAQLEKYSLNHQHLADLYALSFFDFVAPEGDADEAFRFFLKHSGDDWLDFNPGMQAMAALVLERNGRKGDAEAILASLRERAFNSEDMGMYWKQKSGYHWYQAPVVNQAVLIAAFDEIAANHAETDKMRQWLLSQKRTHSWANSRATAEAIYAILLRGTDWLADQKLPTAMLNGKNLDLKESEAGTGFIQMSWDNKALPDTTFVVEIKNPNPQLMWGGLFHQFEQPADVVSASGGPLNISRKLFREVIQNGELTREPINEENLRIGDLIVVQLLIESDRDMEYVHLHDQRAAGFEPVEQLSGYQYKEGLSFYKTSDDLGTDFFFNDLPKGKYLLSYNLRVSQAGSFNNGFASLQSFYAPEFSSHSQGIRVKILE
ncbi:MAG: MG2 domain-containing protein [Bacteroidetes bacterium]|jgi:uncharacterized protein YfaS (alpha-2-macroglobulin family)|nr:MG2 domain-containing protein [Bacteroidota bacterium]